MNSSRTHDVRYVYVHQLQYTHLPSTQVSRSYRIRCAHHRVLAASADAPIVITSADVPIVIISTRVNRTKSSRMFYLAVLVASLPTHETDST